MAPDPTTLTWLGHATTILELGGVRVLTDPLTTTRLAHLRRRAPVPRDADLVADLVLISHAHLDHLHRPSLRRVARASGAIPAIVPRGTARWVRGLGLGPILEVGPDARVEVAGVSVTAVTAVHDGARWPFERQAAPALGFLVERAGRRAYFAGDTDLFAEMGSLAPVDLALLPIAGWWRTLGPGHLDEQRGAAAAELVGSAAVVPIHWGTYAPEDLRRRAAWLDAPGPRFAEELGARGLGDRLRLLEVGASTTW